MQSSDAIEWLALAGLCAAAAAAAVRWLAPSKIPAAARHELLSPDRSADAVFLFDGGELIACSSGACDIVGDDSAAFTWARLRDALGQNFPGLPQSPSFLKEIGPLVLPSAGGASGSAGAREAHCEWIDGIVRVQLRRSLRGAENKALEQELSTLRAAVHQAPYPVWLQSVEGAVTWTSLAYDELARKLRGREADPALPLFPELGAPMAGGRPERVSIPQPEGGKKLWYSVSASETEAGWLCHAIDVNAVVDAEIAQRNFVQILAKTFSQLSSGLAIFDRNRQLVLFNPVLIDLTALPASFLSARPDLMTFFDRLREKRMMPEPKNYTSWRHRIAEVLEAAAEGRFQETWSLPSGSVYSVTGRPHPDGAIAFLIEDITAEITLTRQFRAELELNQSILDQSDEAIAVFAADGTLAVSNDAYTKLWKSDPEASFAKVTLSDACRDWQDACAPTPAWGEIRDFGAGSGGRAPWWARVALRDGTRLICSVRAVHAGATMVSFRSAETAAAPAGAERFAPAAG